MADLALRVVDASVPPPPIQAEPFAIGTASIIVCNKIDLGLHPDWSAGHPDAVSVSCRTGEGLERLSEAIYQRVTDGQVVWNESAAAVNARHQACLVRSRDSLEAARAALAAGVSAEFVALDLRAALESVGEIVGAVDTEEILGKIFSTFCIGK